MIDKIKAFFRKLFQKSAPKPNKNIPNFILSESGDKLVTEDNQELITK